MRKHYSKKILQQIADNYGELGKIKNFHLFTSGYENSNYFIATNQGQFVIKIFEGMGITRENILFELQIMDECFRRGIKTPQVLRNKSGILETAIHSKFAMVMNFFDGENMNKKTLSNPALL